MPAARNWSASSFAIRGTSPRLWTVGISIACLNTSRVFACHAAGNWVGTVRGSVAAAAAAAVKASKNPKRNSHRSSLRMRCGTLPWRCAGSSGRAVPLGQIFGAAHFLETADGALEFEAAVA